MTILLTKLVTGEELIGDFTPNGVTAYTIKNPLVIQVIGVDNATGHLSIRMLPYVIVDPDGTIDCMDASHMMFRPQAVPAGVEKEYLRNTSSIALL